MRTNHVRDFLGCQLLMACNEHSINGATNFPILARSIPLILVLIDSGRRMLFGLSGPATSQTHHRRLRFVFGRRLVDSPDGNRETTVVPRGNRN